MLYLICAWTIGWVNNREAGDLRRHRAHYDVTVMLLSQQYYNIFNSRQGNMPYWIIDALLSHHTNATGSDNDQSCYINVTNYCRNRNPCLPLKWRQHQFIIWIFWPVKISQKYIPKIEDWRDTYIGCIADKFSCFVSIFKITIRKMRHHIRYS